MQVVMFEVGERAETERNQNSHNPTVGKEGLATPASGMPDEKIRE